MAISATAHKNYEKLFPNHKSTLKVTAPKNKISWLMGTVQLSLFAHLDQCLPVPFS
ncbi:MAG: hypothetical protein ABSA86_09280 [Oryzomonas sp.]|jgi:hypothetical protein